MKILIYRWNSYNQNDIESAFKDAGCVCDIFNEKSQTMKTTRYSVKNFIPYLKKETMISAFPLIFSRLYQKYVMILTPSM